MLQLYIDSIVEQDLYENTFRVINNYIFLKRKINKYSKWKRIILYFKKLYIHTKTGKRIKPEQ